MACWALLRFLSITQAIFQWSRRSSYIKLTRTSEGKRDVSSVGWPFTCPNPYLKYRQNSGACNQQLLGTAVVSRRPAPSPTAHCGIIFMHHHNSQELQVESGKLFVAHSYLQKTAAAALLEQDCQGKNQAITVYAVYAIAYQKEKTKPRT